MLRRRRHRGPARPAPLPPGTACPPLAGVSGLSEGRVMVVFLTTGCRECGAVWDALGPLGAVPGRRLVLVTPGPGLQSRRDLERRLAGRSPEVVMDDGAWSAWAVPGAPWAVVVDRGHIVTSGPADPERLLPA